jgi:hypothetical protein
VPLLVSTIQSVYVYYFPSLELILLSQELSFAEGTNKGIISIKKVVLNLILSVS